MALTINDVSPYARYTATSGQTSFSVPFEFFDNGDLVVENNGTVLTYAASPANATQYSVTGAGVEGGGSITLGGSGATLNDVVVIYRDIPIERSADYPETGPMAVASLNTEQAKHIAIMQQLERDLDRAIKAALGTTSLVIDWDSVDDDDALVYDSASGELKGEAIATVANTYVIGGTDVAVADGGTGASTAEDARTNLGLEIGTDVQAWDAQLDDIAGLTPTDGNIIVGDGTNWVAESGATARTSLGLAIGTDVQAYDADLASVAAGTHTTALKPLESIILACSDETTDLATGTAALTFRMPYAFTLTDVRASVTTAPTGSVLTVDINESGTTILSTKLTIDASEKTSTTAATAAVISDSALADDAEITVDIDGVGSTVAGAGLKVTLIGYRT